MKNRLSQAIFSPIFCQAVYKAMLSSWREPPIHPPPSTSVSPTARAPPPASSSPGTPRHRSIFSLSFVHHTVCTHCDQGLSEFCSMPVFKPWPTHVNNCKHDLKAL